MEALEVEQFDHIQLTEEETKEALRVAREAKHYLIEREKYNEKLRAERAAVKYTWEEIMGFYRERFTIDPDNEEIVINLCKYFACDDGFKGDSNKGLLLFGGVGIGKSTLMQFFTRNQKASFRLINCRDIESDFSSDGEKSVQNCSYNIKIATNSDRFGHTEMGFCFDDLGTEANGKHYGKEKNVMAEILLNRYQNIVDERGKCVGKWTHVTTNLSADELMTQYGSRVIDRMKEMFNIIVFPENAKSRRS